MKFEWEKLDRFFMIKNMQSESRAQGFIKFEWQGIQAPLSSSRFRPRWRWTNPWSSSWAGDSVNKGVHRRLLEWMACHDADELRCYSSLHASRKATVNLGGDWQLAALLRVPRAPIHTLRYRLIFLSTRTHEKSIPKISSRILLKRM